MTIWFTSDLHLGHANIIKYCKRPFTTVDEMNSKLIQNWNALVKPQDSVYVIGDFAFSRTPAPLFDALNGGKHLIKGNHDSQETLRLNWNFVKDVYELRYKDINVWLSHYPHRTWPRSHHGAIHCYGHMHSHNETAWGKSLDVGVDAWNYSPISIDQVIAYCQNLQQLEHHGD